MQYLVSVRAYGDCLITLSLLEQLAFGDAELRILGTALTRGVSSLLRKPLPVIELLPDKAAFYAVKQYGLRKSLRDLISLRRAMTGMARPGDVFAFEYGGLRTALVKPSRCAGVYAPQTHRAYIDRQSFVRTLRGHAPEWQPAPRPAAAIRTILINPCARFGDRWLAPEIVSHVIEIAASRNWAVSLLDPCRQYADFQSRVAQYRQVLPLQEAADLLRAADLYVGPDSFFIHLAYYYRVPCFGFFFSHYHDFLAPGMEQMGNYMDFEAARERRSLERKLLDFVG